MKYLIYTAFYTALLTAGLYLFVLQVDPYDVYGFNLLNYPHKAVRTARNNKFNFVDSHPDEFKTVIIGSSRAERFNPTLFEKCAPLPAYNYSVENANAEDLLTITKHVIETQDVDTILLFVDFYMYNGYIGYDRRFMRSPLISYLKDPPKQSSKTSLFDGFSVPYWHASYLSTRGLSDALRLTIKKLNNERHSPVYLENGQHVIEEADKNPKLASAYFEHQYKDFRPDEERMEMFREIKELIDKNHIKVRVILTPMMPVHYEKILSTPRLATNFHQFRKEIVSIFGQVIDFNNSDVSHFSQNKNWYDSVHPTEEFAEVMTDIICGVSPTRGKFGKILHQ